MRKLTLTTAALLGAALLSPAATATATADDVDTVLDNIPAGYISCAQAAQYYTNPGDYNAKRSQALALAAVHRRGGEIRNAVARADEIVNRCHFGAPISAPAPVGAGTPASAGAPAPAPAPAPAGGNIIPILVQPGQPTVDIPVGPVILRIPDIAAIAQQLGLGSSR